MSDDLLDGFNVEKVANLSVFSERKLLAVESTMDVIAGFLSGGKVMSCGLKDSTSTCAFLPSQIGSLLLVRMKLRD